MLTTIEACQRWPFTKNYLGLLEATQVVLFSEYYAFLCSATLNT